MHTPPSVDREAFQQLLSNAYTVQQSQIDRQSLADIMEVQRAIASEEFNVDCATQHIVDSARRVCNATGAAISVLNQNHLVYWAASGSLADSIGKQVTVSLTASANEPGRAILRVENAAKDTRIEADVCRQYGANALLMLPIHYQHALVGVLEIRFAEAHAFEKREMITYRLMVEQIESAMHRAVQLEQEFEKETNLASSSTPLASDQSEPEEAFNPTPAFTMLSTNEPSLYRRVAAVAAAIGEVSVFKRPPLLLAAALRRARSLRWHPSLDWRPHLNWPLRHRYFAVVSAIALGFTVLFAYRVQHPARPSGSSPLPASTSLAQPISLPKPSPVAGPVGASRTLKAATQAEHAPGTKRVRDQEVHYIGDDVTVRVFHDEHPVKPGRASPSRVAHMGSDVTVRYFPPLQPAAKSASR